MLISSIILIGELAHTVFAYRDIGRNENEPLRVFAGLNRKRRKMLGRYFMYFMVNDKRIVGGV
jgi:hypothetical protein